MDIVLDHAIVPAPDKHAAATFFAELLDLAVSPAAGPFIPVAVNDDLTLDFDDRNPSAAGHFGFRVDGPTFDAVVSRLARWPAVDFGSGPAAGWDRRTGDDDGARRVYVKDPTAGHVYEFFVGH